MQNNMDPPFCEPNRDALPLDPQPLTVCAQGLCQKWPASGAGRRRSRRDRKTAELFEVTSCPLFRSGVTCVCCLALTTDARTLSATLAASAPSWWRSPMPDPRTTAGRQHPRLHPRDQLPHAQGPGRPGLHALHRRGLGRPVLRAAPGGHRGDPPAHPGAQVSVLRSRDTRVRRLALVRPGAAGSVPRALVGSKRKMYRKVGISFVCSACLDLVFAVDLQSGDGQRPAVRDLGQKRHKSVPNATAHRLTFAVKNTATAFAAATRTFLTLRAPHLSCFTPRSPNNACPPHVMAKIEKPSVRAVAPWRQSAARARAAG